VSQELRQIRELSTELHALQGESVVAAASNGFAHAAIAFETGSANANGLPPASRSVASLSASARDSEKTCTARGEQRSLDSTRPGELEAGR
jgi:hypothetical protein